MNGGGQQQAGPLQNLGVLFGGQQQAAMQAMQAAMREIEWRNNITTGAVLTSCQTINMAQAAPSPPAPDDEVAWLKRRVREIEWRG